MRKLKIPAKEGYGERGFPSWGIPPTPEHAGPARLSETERWAHTTLAMRTGDTTNANYGVQQNILSPHWFSWQG